MTKRIAVINDLSGFGRCSLTAAISVHSAMGVQACPLPTAILTAQTGYPSYYCDDYTDKMEHYRAEWEKMGQHFDGIYTGFVAGEAQIRQIFNFIDTFDSPDTFLLVDPVMGDNGRTYSIFTPSLLAQMRRLAMRADIITPNLTEFCLLAEADYNKIANFTQIDQQLSAIRALGQSFCQDGSRDIIVTGINFTDADGTQQVGNLYMNHKDSFFCSLPYVGGSYSGTGDLFASCISAGMARGIPLPDIMQTAGQFLELAIKDTVADGIPRNDGVNYEKYLSCLIPECNNFFNHKEG